MVDPNNLSGAIPADPTFIMGEEPEYLKALNKQPISYNQGTNTLTKVVGQTPNYFTTSQQPVQSQMATGATPWMQDPGYMSMDAQQQQEFNALMNAMEGYQQSAYASGTPDIWTSAEWEDWYQKQIELEDQWGWMMPVQEQRDPVTGQMTGYMSLAGKYDYLQPGQYAKTTDNQGNTVYYYKDPSGKNKNLLASYTEPTGLYNADKADLYGVSESAFNPKTVWDDFALTYKYPTMPGLGKLSQETQDAVAPYMGQITELQSKITELQNMRPEDRAAKEAETGTTLTSYVADLQDLNAQMATILQGTGVKTPEFDPVTGKSIGPAKKQYDTQTQAYRDLLDMLAQPYKTKPTREQQMNSLALDLLLMSGMYNQPYYMPSGYQMPSYNITPQTTPVAPMAQADVGTGGMNMAELSGGFRGSGGFGGGGFGGFGGSQRASGASGMGGGGAGQGGLFSGLSGGFGGMGGGMGGGMSGMPGMGGGASSWGQPPSGTGGPVGGSSGIPMDIQKFMQFMQGVQSGTVPTSSIGMGDWAKEVGAMLGMTEEEVYQQAQQMWGGITPTTPTPTTGTWGQPPMMPGMSGMSGMSGMQPRGQGQQTQTQSGGMNPLSGLLMQMLQQRAPAPAAPVAQPGNQFSLQNLLGGFGGGLPPTTVAPQQNQAGLLALLQLLGMRPR